MKVAETRDKNHIHAFLQQDRFYAAYAIGDLEAGLFEHSQWFLAETEGSATALVLLFHALSIPALFTMGRNDGLEAILAGADTPSRVYVTALAHHLAVVARFFELGGISHMQRLRAIPADFGPVRGPVVRLGMEHLDQLQQLYQLGGGDAFAPYQLHDGVYYGVQDGERVVSVAGTHLLAPSYGIAAVGNVFTHPDYRNLGYATICTSAVTEELFQRGMDIVLNVGQDNAPAIRAYRKLGYQEHCRYVEVIGSRHDQTTKRPNDYATT